MHRTDTRTHTPEVIDLPEQTALARAQNAAVVTAASPEVMAQAITAYVSLQKTLDAALPDCIMRIQGRAFRKKNYWRAVATAFNLTLECAEERWEQFDGDWVCDVTYRAVAPNGRTAYGDGSCAFREKKGAQGTRHNVRSHAHTRAYNRAVSNLVGFGEVSAEEVDRESESEVVESGPMELVTFRQWLGWGVTKGGWTKDALGALLAPATNAEEVPENDRRGHVARIKAGPPKQPETPPENK